MKFRIFYMYGTYFGLFYLKALDLSYNLISSLPQDTFSYNSYLKYLNLKNNKLSNLPNGVFDNLTQLKYLDLRDTAFVEILNKKAHRGAPIESRV